MYAEDYCSIGQSYFKRKSTCMIDECGEPGFTRKASGIDDRFIPSAVHKNIFDLYQKENNSGNGNKMDEEKRQFDNFLKRSILRENCNNEQNQGINRGCSQNNKHRKLLRYNCSSSKEKDELLISPDRKFEKKTQMAESRKIKEIPFKILDAPNLQDDFYFNIVDWSYQNHITIGLMNHVYSLNSATGKSFKLASYYGDSLVSSIKSNDNGSLMAVATNTGKLEVFDFEKCTNIKSIQGHSGRIGALAWKENVIASGSRDTHILLSDVRSRKPYEKKLEGHKQEICGLQFNSFDWNLASGGNDNKVLIWDIGSTNEVVRCTEHTAAVKAICWSPHQNGLLASGGGSTDKTIKLWNTKLNHVVKSIDTGSQVCSLRFSKSINELVSTHGFSQNQIELWKVPNMERVATLRGHTERVLYLDMSPSGEDIITASADETLRFWKVFPSIKSSPNNLDFKVGSMASCMDLR